MYDQIILPSPNGNSGITYNEIIIFACLVVSLLTVTLVVSLMILWLLTHKTKRIWQSVAALIYRG